MVKWISFNWGSSSFGGRRFEKTAMIIDVDLSLTGTKEIMQIDLGANETIFYHSKLLNLIPEDTLRLKSLKQEINGQKVALILNSIDIKIGDEIFSKERSILLFDQALDSNDIVHHGEQPVGTIGADFCTGKVLVIDYPNSRLVVSDSIPSIYSNLHFISIRLKNHFIILPLEINGKIENFIFDTGSSLFSMVIDKDNWDRIPKKGKSKEFNISVWNSIYAVFENTADIDIKFDGLSLNNYPIYYSSHLDIDSSYFRSIDVMGIVGNRYFLERTIVIDFKERKFAIINN